MCGHEHCRPQSDISSQSALHHRGCRCSWRLMLVLRSETGRCTTNPLQTDVQGLLAEPARFPVDLLGMPRCSSIAKD